MQIVIDIPDEEYEDIKKAGGKRVIDLGLNDETQAFCEMAIQTLDQKPCEDAISRQAAIDLVSIMYLGNDSNSSYRTDGDTGDTLVGKFQVIDGLSDLPPVTSQPKIGHWIDADGDNARCSCCNSFNFLYGTYCKHCGSKMQEVTE